MLLADVVVVVVVAVGNVFPRARPATSKTSSGRTASKRTTLTWSRRTSRAEALVRRPRTWRPALICLIGRQSESDQSESVFLWSDLWMSPMGRGSTWKHGYRVLLGFYFMFFDFCSLATPATPAIDAPKVQKKRASFNELFNFSTWFHCP